MTIDTNDILNSILESLSRIDYIHPEDIPNIDLYITMQKIIFFRRLLKRNIPRIICSF